MSQPVWRHRTGAAGALARIGQRQPKILIKRAAGAARQQQPGGLGQVGGGSLGAQFQNRSNHMPDMGIGRNEAFGKQLANGHVQCPLVRSDLAQAIQRQIDAFADADSGGARQQQGKGVQAGAAAQFLLQEPVVFIGKRSGQIARKRGDIRIANEAVRKRVAAAGEVVEQTAETDEAIDARLIGEGRILFAHAAEPGEQVRVAPQLGGPVNTREGLAQKTEEVADRRAIVGHSARAKSEGEGLNPLVENLFETGAGPAHGICPAPKGDRC